MSWKRKVSIGILTLVCGVMLLFAFEVFSMASGGKLMPLMEDGIGKTASEIDEFSPELLRFLFTLMKVIPILIFSLSAGILLLLYGPYKRNKKWASFAIFIPLFIWLPAATFIYREQPAAPWQIWFVLLILVVLALLLNLSDRKRT